MQLASIFYIVLEIRKYILYFTVFDVNVYNTTEAIEYGSHVIFLYDLIVTKCYLVVTMLSRSYEMLTRSYEVIALSNEMRFRSNGMRSHSD